MPKFIYTILFAVFILFSISVYVVMNLNPDETLSKIIFILNFFVTLILLIPLIKTIFFMLIKKKTDIAGIFKSTFKESLLISFLVSFLLLIKLYFELNSISFGILILSLIIAFFTFKMVKKSKKSRIN